MNAGAASKPEQKLPGGALNADVVKATPEALAAYAQACRDLVHAPAQSSSWIAAWANEQERFLIARLAVDGRPLLLLPLALERRGPFLLARFPGGTHANGNFAPACPSLSPSMIEELLTSISAARPDIDAVVLERQAPVWEGLENPFRRLPRRPSPNVSLAVDLTGGFDTVLTRSNGKRKRKQHRMQARKLQAGGPIRRVTAETPGAAEDMLETFFAMKHRRFQAMGIRDVFEPAPVRNALRTLFCEAARNEKPGFVLHGLEVGGRLRAITGSSLTRERVICEFSAIADDTLTGASPGAYLFFENIKDACEKGYKVYDFSVGDEYYKRLWCDLETTHFDSFFPFTPRGRALAAAFALRARAKGLITGNPLLFGAAKSARRFVAGRGNKKAG